MVVDGEMMAEVVVVDGGFETVGFYFLQMVNLDVV